MFKPLFKRIEVFKPYNIPLQPIIISKQEDITPLEEKSKIKKENYSKEFSFEVEHHQNDTASSSGGDIEKPEKEFKIEKALIE